MFVPTINLQFRCMQIVFCVCILQRSLDWLNSWRSNLEAGKIESQDFLTKSTAEGLRVTLTLSIDLSDYLIDKYNFNYLLTGKVNQDSLERFLVQ
eukprot:XP_016663157.1 PREDICTED: uncharacterized protein LOC100574543 isoform X2 [Acyrthosiphon pisum]